MKLMAYIRGADWWSNKMPTLLAVVYATALQKSIPWDFNFVLQAGFLLGSIIIGAVYVSLINDLTDVELDLANGKRNHMGNLPKPVRWLPPFICLVIGVCFASRLWHDYLILGFYMMSWIVFSLYSFPPVRLKDRRWAGVLADASGAHLFPSLYVVYALYSYGGVSPKISWSISIGCWALFHGLRGILWHQYQDRDGDMSSNIRTFATKVSPTAFRSIEKIIFLLEMIALVAILVHIGHFFVYLALMIYIISMLIGYHFHGIKPILILAPRKLPYELALQRFYQSFFPVSLLLVATIEHVSAWWILGFHVIVFPMTLIDIGKNFLKLFHSPKGLAR